MHYIVCGYDKKWNKFVLIFFTVSFNKNVISIFKTSKNIFFLINFRSY